MNAEPVTVLMYHAVEARGSGADPHYTVTPAAFTAHLALLREMGLTPASVRDVLGGRAAGARVAITFDDGHASNLEAAREILEAGGSAELFVNPTNVGRAGFLDWSALAELAKAGISVQSHGHTHRYFDELAPAEVEEELRASKRAIEDRTGQPVSLFAPPGGRLTRRVPGIAVAAGYVAICSSQAGVWRELDERWRIPRIAVLASTPLAQLRRWAAQDAPEILRLRMRHLLLASGKRVLGNRGYERVRSGLLGRR